MRQINSHKVNSANDQLVIEVTDDPGAGGANHRYVITGHKHYNNPSCVKAETGVPSEVEILFHSGPIAEAGVNGITQEALIAICIDRLECFQAGPYACRENALALTKLQEAQHWLHHRTRARMDRGVEGTHDK